jgi:hypothetical protein
VAAATILRSEIGYNFCSFRMTAISVYIHCDNLFDRNIETIRSLELFSFSKKTKDGHFLNNSTTEGDRDLIFSVLDRGESGLSNCVKSNWSSN